MKKIIITTAALMLSLMTTSQIIIYDSIFFVAGKSKISFASTKTVSKISEKVKTMELYDITLTAYIARSSPQKPQQSLAINRFQEISNYLIKQNMGTHIRDIEIVTVGGPENKSALMDHVRNRIDVTIEEKFPDPEQKVALDEEISAPTTEPDSLITFTRGTRIKIKGGSFFPLKISDCRFEIKELFTTDDFIDNNVSTTTSDHQVIKTPIAIRILALPKNSSSPIPVKLQKAAILMIPITDSLQRREMRVFYQAKEGKSFITWKKTRDTTFLRHYEGKNFYMINATQLGWVMIGGLLTSCNCMVSTPQFQEQKLIVVYPDPGSVVFFDNNREGLFKIPCAEGAQGLKTFIKACDNSGQMFSLEKTFFSFAIKKDKSGIYRIRKSDFVRL